MKKSLLLLLALLLLSAIFMLEGGTLATLLIGSALVPMLLGPMLSILFSYSMVELGDAFRDSWSQRSDQGRSHIYQKDLLIIKNLQSSVIGWAAIIFILAVILILSTLNDPMNLGPHVAAATIALLYAFTVRALLLVPMENSILKKIHSVKEL